MNKKIAFIVAFFISLSCLSQHTEKYQNFASKLKPFKTEKFEETYRKGKLKIKGNLTYYKYDDYDYYFITGKYIEYYPNGNIMFDALYDDFGMNLEWKVYDGNGNLLEEYKTIKIETSAKNLESFLFKKSKSKITSIMKRYKFSNKICGWYKVLEGKKIDSKRIGKWMRFNPDGSIKKVKNY